MIDAAAQAFTAEGIRRTGLPVTLQRLSGFAPRSVTFSAEVMAIVLNVLPDGAAASRSGYGAGEAGSLTQDDRQVIVMAADLASRRFPLPIAKGDKLIVTATGEKFNVAKVDPYKRAMAGAIELVITGVP